jgi:hypothetical protein
VGAHHFLDLGAPPTVEVVQRDGARVLVRGTVDAVPEAIYGGAARCIRVIADEIRPLAPCSSPERPA